jgi:ferric-dicitrate binding protein FerR (iron transport regulator)
MGSIRQLISAYLDGELADDDAGRLATALRIDPAELDRFVLNHFIHSQLLDWMDQQRIHGGSICDDCDALDAGPMPLSVAAPRGGAARLRPRLQWMGAVAAALLIAAGIFAVTYVMGSRPVIVAQLTETTNCRWAGTQSEIPMGSLLQDGQQLELEQGSAVVTFASGAKLLLEGPASLRLDSEMEVHLIGGRLAARVPTQARGFTVTSSLAQFVDRGTEFTLKLDAEKSFQLHVFDGLVDVFLDKRFGKAARHPAHIAEVRAVSFDVRSGDIEFMEFQAGKQMPF